MKTLTTTLFVLFAYCGFAQLPTVDSLSFSDFGHAGHEIEGDTLYWHLYCNADTHLDIYFENDQIHRITEIGGPSSNYHANNFPGHSYVLTHSQGIQGWTPITLRVSDSLDTPLFTIVIDFDAPYTVDELAFTTYSMLLCDQFDRNNKNATLLSSIPNQWAQARTTIDEEPFIFGHYESGELVYYDELEGVPFNLSDSVQVARVNTTPIPYDGCNYVQTIDTLLVDHMVQIQTGVNSVEKSIELSSGYPSEICPGQQTQIQLSAGQSVEDWEWYRKGETYSINGPVSNLDTIVVTTPGEYVLVEQISAGDTVCPSTSNIVEVTTSAICQGFVSGRVRNTYNANEYFAGVLVEADNGQVGVTDENGYFEFRFDYGNIPTQLIIIDERYKEYASTFQLDPSFPYLTYPVTLYTYPYYEEEVGLSFYSNRNRPGFTVAHYVNVVNRGRTEQAVDVKLDLNNRLTYTAGEHATTPDVVNGQNLTWNNIVLDAGESKQLKFYVVVDRTTPLGDTLQSIATLITGSNDGDLSNNIDTLFAPVTGSYDPNDKAASFIGYHSQGYVHHTTEFEYKIRFQNTGTDTAFTVRIQDVIDEDFDLSTIKTIDASHKYRMTIDNDTVNWIFENILLVDSTTNEPDSHGFVRFRIKQNPNHPDGTMLTNQAGIFFDFNDPIITNEVVNEVGEPSGKILSIDAISKNSLQVYPNPTTSELNFSESGEVVIYNVMGELQYSGRSENLNVSTWPMGVYYYELNTNENLHRGSFMKE